MHFNHPIQELFIGRGICFIALCRANNVEINETEIKENLNYNYDNMMGGYYIGKIINNNYEKLKSGIRDLTKNIKLDE